MDLDFKLFIKLIKEKTNIDLVVYAENGDYVAGEADSKSRVDAVEQILSDVAKNITLFPLKHRSKVFIGCINGAGMAERNYAVLISELAENLFFKEPDLSRADFFKAVLLGELNYSQLRKYTKKFAIPNVSSCAMVVASEKGRIDEVINVLNTYGAEGLDFVFKLDDTQCALIKFNDSADGEYQSYAEYAEFMVQSVYEELGIRIYVSIGGTVQSVYDLSSSFQQAQTATRMAHALGAKGEVHSFKEYVLIKMLEDLPKFKLNEYMEILMDASAREIFNDEEMINTAEEFLENNLNISETSRKLFLHRNTLMYRLDKIEKQTGLNLRKFSDAVTFRLITVLARLVK